MIHSLFSASSLHSLSLDIPNSAAFFIERIPGSDVSLDRVEAIKILRPIQKKLIHDAFPPSSKYDQKIVPLITAEQIHGSEAAVVKPPFNNDHIEGVDALITSHRGVILGIDVADCAPVWIIERTGKVGAVIHSGKKGTLAGIIPKTITRLTSEFSIDPVDLILIIGPCIRPPCYEIDFAKIIREQASIAGITSIYDEQICTACHLERYYSYRREKGKTGRMLAALLLK